MCTTGLFPCDFWFPEYNAELYPEYELEDDAELYPECDDAKLYPECELEDDAELYPPL